MILKMTCRPDSVQKEIARIIAEEDKRKPLSDQKIVSLLKRKKILKYHVGRLRSIVIFSPFLRLQRENDLINDREGKGIDR